MSINLNYAISKVIKKKSGAIIKKFFEQNPNEYFWESNTPYPMDNDTVTFSHHVIKRERKEKYPFVIIKPLQTVEKGPMYFQVPKKIF